MRKGTNSNDKKEDFRRPHPWPPWVCPVCNKAGLGNGALRPAAPRAQAGPAAQPVHNFTLAATQQTKHNYA